MFTEYGSPAKSCIFVGSPVLMLFWYHLHVSATNDLVSIFISPFPEDTGIYRISGSAWCFLAVDTAFWLYLRRLLRNNPENCETPSPCQTLSSCLRATRATLWR